MRAAATSAKISVKAGVVTVGDEVDPLPHGVPVGVLARERTATGWDLRSGPWVAFAAHQ
jgi:hypothetical protein